MCRCVFVPLNDRFRGTFVRGSIVYAKCRGFINHDFTMLDSDYDVKIKC